MASSRGHFSSLRAGFVINPPATRRTYQGVDTAFLVSIITECIDRAHSAMGVTIRLRKAVKLISHLTGLERCGVWKIGRCTATQANAPPRDREYDSTPGASVQFSRVRDSLPSNSYLMSKTLFNVDLSGSFP